MSTPDDEKSGAPSAPKPERPPYPPYRPNGLILFLLMPISAAIVAILIAGGGPTGSTATSQPTPPVVAFTPFSLIGQQAPDFTLDTPDGGKVKLSDYRGKWLILNFWATWCQPCRDEMPLLQDVIDGKFEAAAKVPGGVAVLAINRQEPPDLINGFLKELNLRLPVALDPQATINNRYGVIAMPVTYFIAPDGIVRLNKHLGVLTPKLMTCYLQKMAGETGDCA